MSVSYFNRWRILQKSTFQLSTFSVRIRQSLLWVHFVEVPLEGAALQLLTQVRALADVTDAEEGGVRTNPEEVFLKGRNST